MRRNRSSGRQVQVEAGEGRHMEYAGLDGKVEHMSADAAILAQEVKVKPATAMPW